LEAEDRVEDEEEEEDEEETKSEFMVCRIPFGVSIDSITNYFIS